MNRGPVDGFSEPEAPGGVRSEEGAVGPDEGALLAAIRRGDADAFETVARAHSPRLFRLAMRLCGKREDAEDLVQETLLRTLPKLRVFEGRARISTYLVRALVNLWRNRLRSRRRWSWLEGWYRGREGSDDPPPDAIDPAPDGEERLIARGRAAEVRAAVAEIEPARRLTLLLREVEGLSYEEIAEMTGVAVGTVRSRLARAREELRRRLGSRP